MTMMLAPYSLETVTNTSPAWVNFAKQSIYHFLTSKNFPVGLEKDNDLLFIGETSPAIQTLAMQGKKFSVLLFVPNPFHVLSEYVLERVDTIYTINHEHAFLIREALNDRYGDTKQFNIMNWMLFPTPFEPPSRNKKMIGIIEPDFNTQDIFDKIYFALDNVFTSKLYNPDYTIAFYTFQKETYDRIIQKSANRASSPAIYYLDDPKATPIHDVTLMPNCVLTFDAYRYNPILSSWAQRVPVVRPEWAVPHHLEKMALSLTSAVNGAGIIHDNLNTYVNQIQKIEELEKSPRLQDVIIRASLLGDLYGDFSRSRRLANGSKDRPSQS